MNTIMEICKIRRPSQHYALLFALLATFICTSTLANLSVSAITQTPDNNVWPVQPITYSITVSTDLPDGVFFNIRIEDANRNNISAEFTTIAPCGYNGIFFCGEAFSGSPLTLQFSWEPSFQGSATITFHVGCSGTSCVPAAPVTVTTTIEPEPGNGLIRTILNDTQRATAETLDKLCADTSSETLISQCSNLSSLSDSEISIALNQIAPDEVTAQGSNSISVTTTQLTNVRSRLASLRSGPSKTRFALKGIMLAMNGDTLPAGLLADSSGFGSGLISSLIKDSRLGLFMSGRINFGEKDSTSRESGFDFETQGITAGLDYWYSSKLVMGAALGYAKTSSDFNENGGNLDSTAHSTSFYGSYYLREDAYIDWIASFGKNNFSTRRTIVYSGVNTATGGDTSGRQLGLSSTATIDYRMGRLLISPYIRVDYVNADIKGYRETGGSGLALAIAKQQTKSFATALAVRASQAISQRWGVLVPSAYVEWEHEFKDDGRLITARFVEDPTVAFSIPTDAPDRDYFKLGVALAATFPRGKSAYISFATISGQDTITSATIDLGGRMEF